MFNRIVNTYSLRELPLLGGKYTWSNNRNNLTLEKLDRILIIEEWKKMFPLCNVKKIPRYMSDHNLLIYNSEMNDVTQNKKGFCFENSWLVHEFLSKIEEIWNMRVISKYFLDTWCIKMNRVKKILKGEGKSLKSHIKKYKNVLKNEIAKLESKEEQGSLSANLLSKKAALQTELGKMYEKEESYCHKRSNVTWLLKGDNNTKKFHRIANGENGKNIIVCLQEENGGGRSR